MQSLDDLEKELKRSAKELQLMAEDAEGDRRRARLDGKAEGVLLALGKLQQWRRENQRGG